MNAMRLLVVHTAEYGDVFYVLIRDITEIHDMREMLTETDYLTELYNRRHFDRELLRNLSHILHLGGRLALIMLDIDKFHDFNDVYGHLIGDRCLSQVASAMRRALHRQNDLPFRYGGEEFAVLLPGAKLERAAEVAENIRLGVRSLGIPHEKGPCNVVTISAGVAVLESEEARCVANPSAELIRLADAALYDAKNAGRDTVRTRNIQFSILR